MPRRVAGGAQEAGGRGAAARWDGPGTLSHEHRVPCGLLQVAPTCVQDLSLLWLSPRPQQDAASATKVPWDALGNVARCLPGERGTAAGVAARWVRAGPRGGSRRSCETAP